MEPYPGPPNLGFLTLFLGQDTVDAVMSLNSFGLAGMRERVALLGGSFQIQSFPESAKRGRGTRIQVELPVSKEGMRRGSARRARQTSNVQPVLRQTAAILG